jgi:hypothetical protein
MNKPRPSSVTIEEAVARMVNMDYIPDGCTLLEMTEAFLQEAEADVDEARTEGRPSHVRLRLEERLKACRFRHELAETLLADIEAELRAGGSTQLVRADDGAPGTRLTTESVWEWSGDRYGIGIPEWAPPTAATLPPEATWEDITIKIYANQRLGWSYKGEAWRTARFEDVDLMGKKHREPNLQGAVLTAMSMGRRFPPNPPLSNEQKTLMTRLRRSLQKLTGIRDPKPFKTYNVADGYRPRFVLIDDRRNADERAKRAAIHVPEPEAADFDDEDDDAQKFIDDHDRR